MTGVQTCALPICFPVTISIEEQHIVMLGKYRISETFESKEEAIKDANSITWNRITQLITVMLRLDEEVKELKNKENE